MQLNGEKTDAVWRLEFVANQLIGKTSFPKAKWNKAEYRSYNEELSEFWKRRGNTIHN